MSSIVGKEFWAHSYSIFRVRLIRIALKSIFSGDDLATDMHVNVVGQKLLAYSIIPKSELIKLVSEGGFLSGSVKAKYASKLELIELVDDKFWSTCAFLKLLEDGVTSTVIAGRTRSLFLRGSKILPHDLANMLGIPSSLSDLPLCFVRRRSYFGKVNLASPETHSFSIKNIIRGRRHNKVKLLRNGILRIELSRSKLLNLIPLSTTEGLKLYNRIVYPYLVVPSRRVGGLGVVPSAENSLGIARYQPVCVMFIAPVSLEGFRGLLYEIRIYAGRSLQKQLKQLHRVLASVISSISENNHEIEVLSDVVQSSLNMREVSRSIYRYFTNMGFSTSFVSLKDVNYTLFIYENLVVGPMPRPLNPDKLRESIDEMVLKIERGEADDIFTNYDVTYIKFLLKVGQKHEEILNKIANDVKQNISWSPYYLNILYGILRSAQFLGVAPRSLRVDAYSNMTEDVYMQMLKGVLLPTMKLLIESEAKTSEETENLEKRGIVSATKVAKTAAGEW